MKRYFRNLLGEFTFKKLFILLFIGFAIGVVIGDVLALIVDFDVSRQLNAKKTQNVQMTEVSPAVSTKVLPDEKVSESQEEFANRNSNYELKIFMEENDKNVCEMQQYLIHRDRHDEADAVIESKRILDRYQRAFDLIDGKVLEEYLAEDRKNWDKVEPIENEWTSTKWKELKLKHEELILEAKRLQFQRMREK